MPPLLTLLLGFVFALEQMIWAYSGSSFYPCIWAVLGSVIPIGGSVSIFCRVPPGVILLRLYHEESGGLWDDRHPEGAQDVVNFSLPIVMQIDAGRYYCHYWKQGIWAEQSESLELAVTGIYKDQPSLTAHPSAQMVPGGNLTLRCQPVSRYDTFILCRGGGDSFPHNCSRQNHSSFLISFLNLDQAGTYTCYAAQNSQPQLWTVPSNPLFLSVKLTPDDTTENIIRLSLGILILLVLGAVLLDAWKGRNGL